MRKLQGTVVSNKMQKTVVIRVDRLKKHPKYQKYYRVSRKFKAHDEKNEYKVGDMVEIQEIRPLSKDKRWEVSRLIKRPEIEEINE
jgi:small subunit ribosomal protein S17